MYNVKKQNSVTTGKGLSAHEDLSINVSAINYPYHDHKANLSLYQITAYMAADCD